MSPEGNRDHTVYQSAEQRLSFEEKYEQSLLVERTQLNDNGSETVYRAYSGDFAPGHRESEQNLATFVVEMLQAGYTEAADRLVLPKSRVHNGFDNAPATTVIFFLQKPGSPQPR